MKVDMLLALGLATTVGACGGDDNGSTDPDGGGPVADPAADCEEAVEAICAIYYDCLTEAEREFLDLPATEGACVSQGKADAGCEEQTIENVCEGSEVYQPDQADRCLDQITALSCGQARDGVQAEEETPACQEVCQVE